jgi:hypothetical protein
MSREQQIAESVAFDMTIPCPRCGAAPMEPCRGLEPRGVIVCFARRLCRLLTKGRLDWEARDYERSQSS